MSDKKVNIWKKIKGKDLLWWADELHLMEGMKEKAEAEAEIWKNLAIRLAKCCELMASNDGIDDDEFLFLADTQLDYEKTLEEDE